jgi:hypothetical protein
MEPAPVLAFQPVPIKTVGHYWFGIKKRDKNIYLPCVGWIALNSAVIAGAIIYG